MSGLGRVLGFGLGRRRKGSVPASIAPLTIVTPPVISGSATEGATLTVSSAAVWSGTPASRVYQWFRNTTAISGANGASYVNQSADVSKTVTVKEQANNGSLSSPSQSNGIGPIAAVDTTAPTLSSPVGTETGTTTATVGATTDEGNGTLFFVVTTSATAPSATQVEAGQNNAGAAAVASGSQAISATGAKTFAVTGLTASTAYHAYLMHKDAAGNRSAVLATAAFTTEAASVTWGGAGTRAAPTLSYPSPIASNPTTIAIALPADSQSGDVVKLGYQTTLPFSSPTVLTHTVTDADIAAGTFSMGLSAITFSGVTYFQSLISTGGVDSANLSGIVAWGDTVAPVISTSGTQTITETSPLAIVMAATDTGGVPNLLSDGASPGYYIAGGADQLQYALAISGGNVVLEWYGNGSQSYASPVDQDGNNTYLVDIKAVDYSGNQSTAKTITTTVTQIDTTPDAFTFTNVSNATLNTQYTSNTVTISGLQAGFAIAASVAGSGFTYSKNGGAYTAAGSFTVQNGDTLTLRDTSASSNSVTNTCTVTVGTYATSWSVATPGSAATLTIGTGSTGAGTSRSKYINCAAGTQFIHNTNDGGYAFIKATIPVANTKWHYEQSLDGNDPSTARRSLLALVDSSLDCNFGGSGSTFNRPGASTVPGFTLQARIGGNQIDWFANGTGNSFASFGVTFAAGDRLIVEGDEIAHVYKVYFWDASAGALANGGAAVGTLTLTSLLPTTAYIASGGNGGDGTVANSDSGTAYFNPASFVMTPTSGYSYYA